MAGGVSVGGWEGFGGLAVGVAGGLAGRSAVGALLVVVLAEQVELLLEDGDAVGGGMGRKPAFEGLVEALGRGSELL